MGSGVRATGVLLAAALALTGCGEDRSVMIAAPAPVSYGGPLWVPPSPGVDPWRDPGAAGRVVDCSFPVVGETSTNPYTGGEVGSTATRALQTAVREGVVSGLTDELRVAREEDDRVLYAYTVDGRTLQAVIMHRGPAAKGTGAGPDGIAWWVESWARCNIAEFPDRVAEERGIEVWSDARGRRVPTTTITSSVGTGECLGGVRFLELAAPRSETAVRDEDDLPDQYVFGAGSGYAKWFAEPDRKGIRLPGDAVDTGYHRGADHLWLSPDRARAYVGSRASVDLWPRTVQTLGCA